MKLVATLLFPFMTSADSLMPNNRTTMTGDVPNYILMTKNGFSLSALDAEFNRIGRAFGASTAANVYRRWDTDIVNGFAASMPTPMAEALRTALGDNLLISLDEVITIDD